MTRRNAQHTPEPEPICRMDDPLPENNTTLVGQIKAFAEARRREALTHGKNCGCTPCKVRRYDQIHPRRAA